MPGVVGVWPNKFRDCLGDEVGVFGVFGKFVRASLLLWVVGGIVDWLDGVKVFRDVVLGEAEAAAVVLSRLVVILDSEMVVFVRDAEMVVEWPCCRLAVEILLPC